MENISDRFKRASAALCGAAMFGNVAVAAPPTAPGVTISTTAPQNIGQSLPPDAFITLAGRIPGVGDVKSHCQADGSWGSIKTPTGGMVWVRDPSGDMLGNATGADGRDRIFVIAQDARGQEHVLSQKTGVPGVQLVEVSPPATPSFFEMSRTAAQECHTAVDLAYRAGLSMGMRVDVQKGGQWSRVEVAPQPLREPADLRYFLQGFRAQIHQRYDR